MGIGKIGWLLLALAVAGRPALAQPATTRPITIVVPFPPGGSTDVVSRLLAERMAASLSQRMVIENRPGAATVVGAEYVARAAADGHTLLMSSGTTLTINPIIARNLPYRVADFVPISLVSKLPFAVVVRPGLPQDIAGFVALARQRPGQLNYGTNGPSSFNNIAMVLVTGALGIRLQDVTYRGDAQQLNDFVAGTLDVLVVGGSSGIQAQRNGHGRIIGWTGEQRLPSLPDVPNFSEGVPGLVAQTWFGLFAPAGTPPAVIARINLAAAEALAVPALRERLLAEGQFAESSTPEGLADFLQQEAARWEPVLRRLDIRLD